MVAMLMAFGVMGGLALVLANMTGQQQTMQKKLQTSFEVNSLFNYITEVLKDQKACALTLGPFLPIINGRNIPYIKNKGAGVIFNTTDTYGNGLIKIASMNLRNVRLTMPPSSPSVPYPVGSGEVELKIVFDKQSKAIKGYKKISRSVPLSVRVGGITGNGLIKCLHADDELPEIVREAMVARLDSLIDGKVATAREAFCVGLGGVYESDACSFPGPPTTPEPNLPDVPSGRDRLFPPSLVHMGDYDCSGAKYECVANQTAIQRTNCDLRPTSGYPTATEDTLAECYRQDNNHPAQSYVSDSSCADAKAEATALVDPGNLSAMISSIEPANHFQGRVICGDCHLLARYKYAVKCRLYLRGYTMRCSYQCL